MTEPSVLALVTVLLCATGWCYKTTYTDTKEFDAF